MSTTSLIITGPTSALLNIGNMRIALGAKDLPPGDVDALVIGRVCVEELASLPAYLRRCNRQHKLNVFVTSVKDLHGMLAADEVCCSYTNGSPLQISLDSWCAATEPNPGETLVSGPGTLLRVYPSSWMRENDSLCVHIYTWDASNEEVNEHAIAVLTEGNEESAAWMDEENKRREAAATQQGWKPVISRYYWAPFQAESSGDHHALFTQTRAPFDATAPQSRQHAKGTVFTDDNVGREYRL